MLPLIGKRSAFVTTVSNASADELTRHLSISRKNIVVLPNGHEHVFRWRAARSTVLSRNMLERPFVLLLGSRARHKNTGLILGLASALDEIGVDIVVTGGNAAAFAGLAKQAVARNVIDVGFVGDDDLAALLSRALCLTFPSITEGFGLPLVEAMALGCPIVSSDRASMPEVCGGAALMAAPDDPDAWLNHIRRLLRSRDMRAEYSTRGFERVTAYSWRNSAEGYLDLVGKGFH
jgi:glycosyltransferase involved in cell wall biosynthesis